MVEVPHGLAGLAGPEHPFAALHTGSCKGENTAVNQEGAAETESQKASERSQDTHPSPWPALRRAPWVTPSKCLSLTRSPSTGFRDRSFHLQEAATGLESSPPLPARAVPHTACLHFVDPLPCPALSKAPAVSKTASQTPHHDYNVPGTHVGKRQLNDVLYFPVGTSNQDSPSSRFIKGSGPKPRSARPRSRGSSRAPSPASHLHLSPWPCSRAPLPGTLHPPSVPPSPSGLSPRLPGNPASSEPTC